MGPRTRIYVSESHRIKTDGVSVRLLYERPKHEPRQRQEGVPKRGLYTVDVMEHISRLSLAIQVVGVDPGMIDLINCVDPTRLLTKGATSPPSNVVYTAKRRKHETCSILYHKKMEAEKREMAPGWLSLSWR